MNILDLMLVIVVIVLLAVVMIGDDLVKIVTFLTGWHNDSLDDTRPVIIKSKRKNDERFVDVDGNKYEVIEDDTSGSIRSVRKPKLDWNRPLTDEEWITRYPVEIIEANQNFARLRDAVVADSDILNQQINQMNVDIANLGQSVTDTFNEREMNDYNRILRDFKRRLIDEKADKAQRQALMMEDQMMNQRNQWRDTK